ncbi:RagB/SusD family nutrient uptake outer membrane protein [Niastella caeni]|uniref:RagB/SusD family nutrient uptake outer membrane protein n=1 Tax=Niastella caeni TaxID=2569763 RepID=A0A4S8HEG8_9BACT|nr:RagB/SusD family nutrient uptake outer membrane protein [Niastella caeni]THU33458.1 RagB/SusD family nutrient uptake outer membrane protein [Niastella caeni]
MRSINILWLVSYIMLVSLTTACKKVNSYLDKAESGGITDKELFNDYVQTDAFLANIYNTGIGAGDWMPVYSFTYAAACDEAKCPYTFNYGTINFTSGLISPTNNPIDIWAKSYQNIRKANIFLQHIDELPVNDARQEAGKVRMKGEAFFLRAFFYEELYKRYGGVPLLDAPLSIDDDLQLPRNSEEEVVAFIVKDCDSAAALLPATHSSENLGRATKGAALLLKSRTLLYAASLLHNPDNNIEKWQQASSAAKAVMDLNVYRLDDNYKTLFHTRTSPEVIFQSTVNQVWKVVDNDWVRHTEPPSQGGGWGNLQPLQNLVDEYEMKNGKYITDPTSGYNAANPYADRDPRFHQSIIYNGRKWGTATINTYVGSGVDGLNYNTAATKTGYYVAKLLDENATLITSYKPGSHYWVFMRYAEALLNYAEAQNEALSAPDQSVYDAVNQIRGRKNVAMPPLPVGLTKEEMRQRIRHERRIELAFETHRFWDLRRWRIGTQEGTSAYGMRITKSGSNFTYQKFLLENRVYRPAFDLFPIPQTEREKDPALTQNPEY